MTIGIFVGLSAGACGAISFGLLAAACGAAAGAGGSFVGGEAGDLVFGEA